LQFENENVHRSIEYLAVRTMSIDMPIPLCSPPAEVLYGR